MEVSVTEKTWFFRIRDFFVNGMWTVRLKDLPPARAYLLRWLRVFVLAFRGMVKDDCRKRASVLTYYSLLNIVPLFAMVFAIAKGFGLEKLVERQILAMAESARWQTDLTGQLLHFSSALLEQAKGGLIAGLGALMIFYTVITILGKIEDAFNQIWNVRKPRTLARKFSDYIAIMVFAPILFVLSNSVTILVTGKLGAIIRGYAPPGVFVDVLFFLLGFLPYLSVWMLLAMVYMAMPNTRAPVRSSIVGAVVAGTVFQVVQWVYIKFQIGVSSYGAIYGSFAALPLFLVWLQTSWTIVLFGAELARANGHFETFGLRPEYSGMSGAMKKLLMTKVLGHLVQRFERGEEAPAVQEIADRLEIPLILVEETLEYLIASGLAVEVAPKGRASPAFQPGRDIENITVKDVFDAGEQMGTIAVSAIPPDKRQRISAYVEGVSEAMGKPELNFKLKDM
jgi:membrane protein